MYIGIDVGGTNLVAGLVDQEGTILHKSACPVNRSWSAEELVSQLAQLSVRAAQEGGVSLEDVEGAGAGIPGLVDNEAGTVVKTPNMPFRDTPFRELFQRELNIPVHLGNDADCAAAGEYWAGAAKGCDPVVMVTLGTGIGTGLVRGGKLYTGFAPQPEYVPAFVSEKEHYKATPQDVTACIAQLDIRPAEKRYLNFVRIDRAKTFGDMEGMLFLATPDILSGLATWAFFDNNAEDAVSAPFGAGCTNIISVAVRENRINGKRTFIGLFDPSARPYVERNELSFVIPACRFRTMKETLRRSCLFGTPAWSKIKSRINGE